MKSKKLLDFPKRKITHLTNEEKIYTLVQMGRLIIDRQGRVWRRYKNKKVRAETTFLNRLRGENQHTSLVYGKVDGINYYVTTARLVWLHFKGRIPHFKVIYAKNGNKKDTRPSNLRIGTFRESMVAYHTRAA